MGALTNTRMASLCYMLIFLLSVATINADGSCSKGCPRSDNGLLKYAPGKFYEYTFESILTVGLSSGVIGEADDTSLKVDGTAKIYAEGNCGYTLQVGAVRVINTKESIEKKIVNNIQKPVHFTLVNGQLEPQICTDANDAAYSLNIKRGIISLLQAGIGTGSDIVSEVDVFGQCPTHVTKSANGDVVTKTRNLNNCANREKLNSGLLTGVVNEKAGITSSSLFQSEYRKETKLGHDIIDYVQLVESYKFTGGSKVVADVHAKVLTTLKLKNAAGSSGAAPATGNHAASIAFQKPETYTAKNIAVLKAAISEIVELNSDYVKKSSAKKFVELVRLFRQADTDTLLELAAFPHPNKALVRKVYLDVLFRTNTAESARAILKQLGKFDQKEKILAILSLNLVETVDKETVNQAAAQLTANAPKEIYLVVGSLVAKHCVRNGCPVNEVDALAKKFADGLKHCKPNTKKEEERIIYALKGIGNAQHLANNIVSTLGECAAAGRSNRIRVAALQTFQAIDCNAALSSKAIDLLKNVNEDSEVRIEAYLAAINCPNAELAQQIEEIVNQEQVNQVGGFIVSNLKTIRDSTDPTREHQRQYLSSIRVTKHFPHDYRRYSFNNEVSYKLDAFGLSSSSDYKLIYSQHGFLPRSARLNVTTEIFGTNFNIFEASVRQENLEKVLEYYLGPKGLLNKDFDEIVKMIEIGNAGGPPAAPRARRSIVEEAQKTAKKYKTYGTKTSQDLNLDLSLKLFGSELAFLSLGDNIPNTLDDIIQHFSTAFDKVKQDLSSFEHQYACHALFLDTDLAYPTGAGVPLEFSAQGFSANKVDFAVNIDVGAILEQNWQRAKYRLKFVPSIDVNLKLQLGFNAQVLATGLQVVSSAHTAAGSDVSVNLIQNGEGFNVDIELPREKLELIDVQLQTEFYVAEQDKQLKSLPLKSGKKQKATNPTELCFNQLEIVGLNVCVVSSTNLNEISGAGKDGSLTDHLHLARPFTFGVSLQTERKFNFKGTHTTVAPGNQQWKLAYSTPGSKVSHDTSVTFALASQPHTYARLSLDNPQFHFAVEAGVSNDNKELVLYGQYEQDKEAKKSKIGFTKNGNEYKPLIEIQDKRGVSNSINGYRADGKIVVQNSSPKQARYDFKNLHIISPTNNRVALNGWADFGPALLNAELKVSHNQDAYQIKANYKIDEHIYAAGLFVNDERTPENVYGLSEQLKIAGPIYESDFTGKLHSWSLKAVTKVETATKENSNSIRLSKFEHDMKLEHKNVPQGTLKIKSAFDTNKFQVNAEATHDQKQASVDVKFQSDQKSVHDYELAVKAKLNKHFVNLNSKCDVEGNLFVLDNTLTASNGILVTLKGGVGQRFTPQDVHIDVEGSAQFTGKDKPVHWLLNVLGTPEKTTSELRVSRDNVELTKLTTESQHPQDKIAALKVNLNVKNLMTLKSDFKVAKNGKGDLTALIETQKTEPKHKLQIDTKFHVQAPKYDVDATILLDGAKKLLLKTENNLEKTKFSTTNVLEANEQKFAFEAQGNVIGEWRTNGDIVGKFKLTTPDGQIIDGSVKNHLVTNPKTHLVDGHAELELANKKSGAAPQSITVKSQLECLNLKTKEFSVKSQATVALGENKIELNHNLQYLLKGKNSGINWDLNARGHGLEAPLELAVVVEEYSALHAIGHVTAKYGGKLSAKLNGNYHVGQSQVPATYDVQLNLQAAQTNFKTFELSSKGKYSKATPENKNAYQLEFSLDEKSGNGPFTRVQTVWKGTPEKGNYNFNLQNNNLEAPVKFNGAYQREQSGTFKDGNAQGKQKYNFKAEYGAKYVNTGVELNYDNFDTATLRYTLDTTFESVKNIEVEFKNQKSNEDFNELSVQAKYADQQYGVITKVYRSSFKKGLDLKITLPKNQPIVLTGIVEILGERKATLTLEIANLVDLDFKLNADAAYINIDDFYINANWNSKKLQLNEYDLSIKAQGKNVKVQLKNVQAVVLTGSATYGLKKEQNKAIIEGQGQVQYNGKKLNGNFKLQRQQFDLHNEKEIGFSYTLSGNFGPKNGVATLKLTNKEFNSKLSVCEEKKQCTNIQLQSALTVNEQQLDSVQQSVLALVDLRELGYPYEFELKSKTTRQDFKYQYNLDSHIISGNNIKYQLTVNTLPTSTTVQLTLPKRQIVFETNQKLPQDGKIFGHYEQSAAFYIDKLQRPQDVARVAAVLDVTGVEHSVLNVLGQLKVEHPTIRPLVVSGKLDANREQQTVNGEVVFDIFKTPDQKITASCIAHNTLTKSGFNITLNQQISSTGLHLRYELKSHAALNTQSTELSAGTEVQTGQGDKASAYIFGNKNRVELSLYGLNEQIFHLTGDVDWQKHVAKVNSKLQILGSKPLVVVSEVQPSWAKLALKQQNLFDVNAEIKLGKEFKYELVGSGKEIINGRVALDAANFLQTTYKANDDDVKAFLSTVEAEIKKETDAITEEVKKQFKKTEQNFQQNLALTKESSPDFSKLTSSYEGQVNAIVKELESDPALKPIIDSIRTLIEKLHKFIGEVTKVVSENYEKLQRSLVELNEKLQDIWKNSLLKSWEQFVLTATKTVGQIRVEISNLTTKAFKELLAWLEQYGPALKNYGKAINEALKPVHEAAQELIKVVVHGVEKLIDQIKEYIAKLPTFESIHNEIERTIKRLKLVEKTLEVLNNVFDELNMLPHTPETKEFLQKLQQYLVAQLRQQPIDEAKWLQDLSNSLLKALRSIWNTIESSGAAAELPDHDLTSLLKFWPEPFNTFNSLPTVLSFRSSLINFLLNENWQNVFNNKKTYYSWVFFHNFELNGHLIDGQHVFSFDGQHYAYPGNCKYILAQDSVDNNFTVVAQQTNGKLKSITLIDRDGNFIEVTDTVALKVNGKPVEFPQHLPGIHAWRRYYTVHLHSEYGVTVVCTTDLKVCHVNVNGFYTSKTRGLLGNGNAEPYDDYLLVDGTLAKDSAALGNDYGIGKCSPVAYDKTQTEPQAENEVCSELFGVESSLALNYLSLNVTPYKKACYIALQSAPEKDKESVACTFALAYGSALKLQHKWVLLPPRCLKCAGAADQREFGETFSVKTPTNKADVVFVVDINVKPAVLAQLVAPAITEIRDALKTRSFTDIQVGVIAYDENKRYPALLTSDNGKLNYKGNVANVQLNGPKNFCDNCLEQIITEKRLLSIYDQIEKFVKTIVPESDEKAFHLALDYPFRAGAAKTIIGVRSNSLEYKNWWKFFRAHITGGVTQFDGALLHLIAPVQGLALEGVNTEKLVGFNARLVATLDGKDNKKRAKLQFENDMGIDFVLNNGGWTFATQNFEKLKAPEQKKFLNQVTSSIADTLFKTETIQDCRCLPVHGLHGQHKCIIKSSTFVANKKPKAA